MDQVRPFRLPCLSDSYSDGTGLPLMIYFVMDTEPSIQFDHKFYSDHIHILLAMYFVKLRLLKVIADMDDNYL